MQVKHIHTSTSSYHLSLAMQVKLEAKVGVLREEAAATEMALEAAEDALAAQKAQIVAQVCIYVSM